MSAPPSRCFKVVRWGAIALFGCAVAIALHRYPILYQWFNQRTIVAWVMGLGPWSVPGFIGAHVVATAIGVPGTVLVLAGGVCFGVVYGTVWSVIGATFGAIAAFGLARTFLRDRILNRWGQSRPLRTLNRQMERSPWTAVLTARFAPISPFNLVNFLFGLTPVPLRIYSIGTLIGIIPGTSLYTWVGSSGADMLAGGNPVPFAIAVTGLGVLSLLPCFWQHCHKNRLSSKIPTNSKER